MLKDRPGARLTLLRQIQEGVVALSLASGEAAARETVTREQAAILEDTDRGRHAVDANPVNQPTLDEERGDRRRVGSDLRLDVGEAVIHPQVERFAEIERCPVRSGDIGEIGVTIAAVATLSIGSQDVPARLVVTIADLGDPGSEPGARRKYSEETGQRGYHDEGSHEGLTGHVVRSSIAHHCLTRGG